ncbi:hypothetical protein [Candidatus Tisiphia endosymbiont of Micropterix aruncella]|uniref:hypothetical protein n=1 Tax=Candidatus Tisiphia endosymbiont of Micropterix aruncella TaxID=3066271 RepID=UPI003AA7CB20
MPVGDSAIKFQKAYSVNEVPSEIKKHLEIPQSSGYFLNSVFTYQKQKEFSAQEDRVEYVYEHAKVPGATVRLVRTPVISISFPPIPDTTQKFYYEELSGLKRSVYYAYRSKNYGSHEVVWQDRNHNYLLLVKPTSWTNREWFLRFLGSYLELT